MNASTNRPVCAISSNTDHSNAPSRRRSSASLASACKNALRSSGLQQSLFSNLSDRACLPEPRDVFG